MVVVVVVVAVAVIVGGLYAAGVFTPASSNNNMTTGPGGGSGDTFSAAATTASSTIASVPGGPWTLIGGDGTALGSSIAVNQTEINDSASASGCESHLLSGASSLTSIPATSPLSPTSGDSNAWVIWYANATFGVLEVAVFSGSATPVVVQNLYGSCGSSIEALSLPPSYENSPPPASDAWGRGGDNWTKLYSDYDVEMILIPAATVKTGSVTTSTPSLWAISYTTCELGSASGATLGDEPVSQFDSDFYSSNGTYFYSVTSSYSCAVSHSGGGGGGGKTKPNLSDCDGFFFETNNSGVDYYNNGTAVCTEIDNLTAGGLTVSIVNNTTHAAVSTSSFVLELQNVSTSAVLATYNFVTGKWSSSSVPIFGADSIDNEMVLVTPTSMAGNNIVFTATSSAWATGSLTVYLGNET